MYNSAWPAIVEYTNNYVDNIKEPNSKRLILFTDDKQYDQKQYFKIFEKLAYDLEGGDIKFRVSCSQEGVCKNLADLLNIRSTPQMVLINPNGKQILKYMYPDYATVMSEKSVLDFLDNFRKGELKPYPRSQMPPAEGRTIPVMTLVGSTHDEVISDPEKDVFVYYYVRGCIHCDNFMPIWEETALKSRYYSRLIMAKINLSDNEVIGREFEHYPTLIYYGRNYKKGVEFYAKPRREEFDIWIKQYARGDYKFIDAPRTMTDELGEEPE